jgi:beta-phosphoglucomutase family hydrolase
MHPKVEWRVYDAVLFDLDGVLTPTADLHRTAWKTTFDRFLASRGDGLPFTDADYLSHVDGKPRYDGVRDFLSSRAIDLPEGAIDDVPGFDTVQALGNQKNATFTRFVDEEGVIPYPGSVTLLDHLAQLDIRVAVVSSSANARDVLGGAGLIDRFRVVVDGIVARNQRLAGKPAPDTFLYAARELGVDVVRSVVVEDAASGVAAGRAGGFGLVIGVDREDRPDRLRRSGADLVVADLADLVEDET